MKSNDREKSIVAQGYTVKIEIPDSSMDLSKSKDNNIVCLKNGQVIWRIDELLVKYSRKNNLHYYNDMYFDIVKYGDSKVKCIGFLNHCIIDVHLQEIVLLINNR